MKKEWLQNLNANLFEMGFHLITPKDIDSYIKNYEMLTPVQRIDFWTVLFTQLCKFESGFNPNATYKEAFKDASGKNVISTGLFQLSVESLRGYKIYYRQNDLTDPYQNIKAALVVAQRWLLKDGVISSDAKPWLGLARYWSPFRDKKRKDVIKGETMKLSKAGETQSIYEKFYETAKKEMGINELSGAKHNKRILEYHATTTLKAKDDETPWCSSFANWVVIQCGVEGTKSAAARSWMKWGKELKNPVKGCIVVFTRTGGGHVAFYHSEDKDFIYVLGGNQSNSVNISAYRKDRLLGFRGV